MISMIRRLAVLSILPAAMLCCGRLYGDVTQTSGRTHEMMLSNATSRWDHAMPTGNGQVGALAFGNVQEETVILTHDSLFIRSQKPTLPNVSQHLPKMRQMIAEGIVCRGGVEVSLKWNMNEKRIDAAFISRTAQKVTVKFLAPVASMQIDSADAKVAASPYGDAYRLLTLPAGKTVAMRLTVEYTARGYSPSGR